MEHRASPPDGVRCVRELRCAIVQLISGFRSVADVDAAEKATVLARIIEDTRPAMLLSLMTVPVAVVGVWSWLENRRRRRQRELEQAALDVF
jgi:hypothetical protein